MKFDWDRKKDAANLRKHGISFQESIPVFIDLNRIETLDDRDDYGEERWLTVGFNGRLLLSVVYTLRGQTLDVYRLISSRKADIYEEIQYRKLHPRS
jgi:uncharacterized DUF497 family protein